MNSNSNDPEGASSLQNNLQREMWEEKHPGWCSGSCDCLPCTECHALSTPHLTASPVLGEGLYPPHLRYGHTRPHRKHAGESDGLPSSHLTPILCFMNNPNKCHTPRVQPSWEGYLECILPNKSCHGQVLRAREPCSDVVESKGAKCLPTAWIHPTARSM